jgi:hypothetical protein
MRLYSVLTQQSEYEVELVLYGGARKQGPTCSHLIKYTPHTPTQQREKITHTYTHIKNRG